MAIKGRTLPGDFEWRGQTIDARSTGCMLIRNSLNWPFVNLEFGAVRSACGRSQVYRANHEAQTVSVLAKEARDVQKVLGKERDAGVDRHRVRTWARRRLFASDRAAHSDGSRVRLAHGPVGRLNVSKETIEE